VSETSRNVVEGFRELRKFCGQVSLLLRTADGLMQDVDWEPELGSTPMADLSKSLHEPDSWLPCYFCRFYKHPGHLHLVAFISVLIEDVEEPAHIDEALLTAGWIDYGVGNKRGDWKRWFCQWHLWMTNREDNGRLHEQDPRKEWKEKAPEGVVKAVTFGYPLDEITSGESLKDTIVDRLISEISKQKG